MKFGPVAALIDNWQLFLRLLKRDIQASFRGSALGLLWIVIFPLVLVGIYSFVFGVILKASWSEQTRSALEVPLIYFTGIMHFTFFIEILTRAPDYIRQNKAYVTKMIFPLEILDWVLIGTAAFKLAIALTLLFVFMIVLTGRLPLEVALVPVLLLPFAAMMAGLAWFLSALGTYVRDFNHLFAAIGPILLFVSPIFYSIEQVPEVVRSFYYLNPLSFVLENMRGLLFFDRSISLAGYLIYCAVSFSVMLIGFHFFRRVRPGFADVV